MPRKRNPENKGLPARWRFTRNAYYYQVPPGFEAQWDNKQTFKLGNTLQQAYAEWAKRIGTNDRIATVAELLDRYLREVVPTKAKATQNNNTRQIRALRAVFGAMPLAAVRPQQIYKYVDLRTGKANARMEAKTFSHVYSKAVEWGLLDRHPFKGQVRLDGGKPRSRYVEDHEIIAALSIPSVRSAGSVLAIQAYIKLKLLTGLRRGDLMRLRMDALKEDGIHVATQKTGRAVIYSWSDELRAAVEEAKACRPVDISPWLFCNRRGEGYFDEDSGEAHGWRSMWKRFMKRVLAETDVKQGFTDHDLRAKCASDATTLEHARALLAHATDATTKRVYRRRAEVVKPLR